MPAYDVYGLEAQAHATPINFPQPAPTKSAAAPPNVGPTGFWGRIGQVGVGKVNLINAYREVAHSGPTVNSNNSILKTGAQKAEKAAAATGRFLAGNTAKFVNQGVQEGKQAVETGRMITAQKTNNPEAFAAANQRSQAAYKGFKTSGGLLNVGTATNEAEARQGALKTGLRKIGGATLGVAAEIVPMATFGKAAKVYKLGQGLVDASHSAMTSIAKNTVLGAISGGAGTVGAELLSNGKISIKDIAKGTGAGAVLGGGTTALGKLVGIFKGGPVAALDKIKSGLGKTEKPTGGMTDVLDKQQLDQASSAAHTKIGVTDETPNAQGIGVRTPVRPGVKDVSATYKVGVRAPVKMSDQEYVQKFNKISQSYDKAYKGLEAMPPAKQKIIANTIDNQHTKSLEQLNKDYKNGVMPEKTTVKQIASSTTKAGKTTGGLAKPTVNNFTGNKKVSEMGGARPNNELQKQIEDAHNTGDTAKTESLIKQLPDASTRDAMRSSVGLPTSETKLVVGAGGKTTRVPIATTKPGQNILKPVKGGTTTAPSQLATKIESKAVANKLAEDLGTLPQHQVMDIKVQAQKATDLINSDSQKAIDIATGKANAPAGVHPHAVFVAVEKQATQDGNVDLLRQLANSKRVDEATAAGQTLRILRERDENSPVAAMQQVTAARTKAIETKTGTSVAKEMNKTADEINSNIKKPSKNDWHSFIESIQC